MNSIEKLLNQHQEDWSLNQKFYKDEAIFDLERRQIFFDSWIFIGHDSQIPNKGDYFIYKILDEEIIVLRNKENQVKAFFKELQSHWSANDLVPMQPRISRTCYGKLDREVRHMKRARRYNFIDKISFSNIQIIGVRDYHDDRKDSFSVLIEGKMLDEMVPIGKRTRKKIRKDFVDIYEFKRIADDDIRLYRILPYRSVYDGIIKNKMEKRSLS